MASEENSTVELKDEQVAGSTSIPCIYWVHGTAPVTTLLKGSHTVIGRGPTCEIQLEAVGVSRKHAEVFRQGAVCALADAGSKNGVFVNGRPVTHIALSVGDILR